MPQPYADVLRGAHQGRLVHGNVTRVDERRPRSAELVEEPRLATTADSASYFWYPGSFSLVTSSWVDALERRLVRVGTPTDTTRRMSFAPPPPRNLVVLLVNVWETWSNLSGATTSSG